MAILSIEKHLAIIKSIIEKTVDPTHPLFVERTKMHRRSGVDMGHVRIDDLITMFLHTRSYFHILTLIPMTITAKLSKHLRAEDRERSRRHVECPDRREHPADEDTAVVLYFLSILQDTSRFDHLDGRSDSHSTRIIEKRHNFLESIRINE